MKDKYHLDINQCMDILLEKYPILGNNIKKYYNKKEGEVIELILETANNNFPLTIRLVQFEGVHVNFGNEGLVEDETTVDDIVIETIDDLLKDKIIVIHGYQSEKHFEKRSNWY